MGINFVFWLNVHTVWLCSPLTTVVQSSFCGYGWLNFNLLLFLWRPAGLLTLLQLTQLLNQELMSTGRCAHLAMVSTNARCYLWGSKDPQEHYNYCGTLNTQNRWSSKGYCRSTRLGCLSGLCGILNANLTAAMYSMQFRTFGAGILKSLNRTIYNDRGDYSGQPSAKMRPISKIAAHFLVWSDTCQINEEWLYTVVLTCVVVNNIVLLLEDSTVHYSVNKYSEVIIQGGRLADWHVRSTIRLI